MAWNWEFLNWDDEGEYFDWVDRVGLLGIAYFLVGISWALGFGDQDSLIYAIFAAFLSGIAIQGFREETDTVWRRAVGVFGTILSLFMLSTTFEDSLYEYITWMFMGVVALGFGFAYLNKMGEVSTLFDESTQPAPLNDQNTVDEEEILTIPKPITQPKDLEIYENEAGKLYYIDEDDNEIDCDEEGNPLDGDEEVESPQPLLEKEIKKTTEKKSDKKEEETEVSESPAKDIKSAAKGKKASESLLKKSSEEQIQTNVHDSPFDLLLDPVVSKAIQDSLAATPHEGFKPVVSIGANGNLKIDFVPI